MLGGKVATRADGTLWMWLLNVGECYVDLMSDTGSFTSHVGPVLPIRPNSTHRIITPDPT